jgi:ATP-dependent helicase/nuclease subunit A
VEPVDLDEEKTPWFPGTEIWDLEPSNARDGIGKLVADLKPAKWSDVAVLTLENAEIERLEEALRRNGVPCKPVGGRRALFTRLEARDLANVLRALADPGDDFSLSCVLRGPMVGLSLDSLAALVRQGTVSEALQTFEPDLPEDREKLQRFRSWYDPLSRLGDRLPAAEVLSRLMAQPGLLETLVAGPSGTRALANLRRIHQMAIAQPELGPLEFADQIQEIQKLRYPMDEPPTNELDQDEATILTVFKSKGLEFDTVVVADLFGNPMRRKDQRLQIDRALGLAVFEMPVAKPLAHRWLRERSEVKDLAETQRLMYVAMTRAKSRLVLAATSKRGQTIAAALVRGFGRSPANWARYSVVRTPDQPEPEPGA